jgi:hypothetical protein
MPVYVWVNFLKFISVGLMLQSPFGAQNSPQGFAESARRFTVGLKLMPMGSAFADPHPTPGGCAATPGGVRARPTPGTKCRDILSQALSVSNLPGPKP